MELMNTWYMCKIYLYPYLHHNYTHHEHLVNIYNIHSSEHKFTLVGFIHAGSPGASLIEYA